MLFILTGPMVSGQLQALSFYDVRDGKAVMTDDVPEVQMMSSLCPSQYDENSSVSVQVRKAMNVKPEVVSSGTIACQPIRLILFCNNKYIDTHFC